MKNASLTLCVVYLILAACHDPEDYELNARADNSDILTVSGLTDSIPADNFSIAPISAFIPIEAAEQSKEVVFETDVGVFKENNEKKIIVSADYPVARGEYAGKREARAILKSSNKRELANVTVSIAGVIKRHQILFYKSFPDKITASASSFLLDSGYQKEITVSAVISKKNGSPTIGNIVQFVVTDKDNQRFPKENFRNEVLSSDGEGKTSAIFTAGNSNYKGIIKVMAFSSDGTSTISDTVYVYKN